jgi:hypothetical protein
MKKINWNTLIKLNFIWSSERGSSHLEQVPTKISLMKDGNYRWAWLRRLRCSTHLGEFFLSGRTWTRVRVAYGDIPRHSTLCTRRNAVCSSGNILIWRSRLWCSRTAGNYLDFNRSYLGWSLISAKMLLLRSSKKSQTGL